jgi:hypothetical protein
VYRYKRPPAHNRDIFLPEPLDIFHGNHNLKKGALFYMGRLLKNKSLVSPVSLSSETARAVMFIPGTIPSNSCRTEKVEQARLPAGAAADHMRAGRRLVPTVKTISALSLDSTNAPSHFRQEPFPDRRIARRAGRRENSEQEVLRVDYTDRAPRCAGFPYPAVLQGEFRRRPRS